MVLLRIQQLPQTGDGRSFVRRIINDLKDLVSTVQGFSDDVQEAQFLVGLLFVVYGLSLTHR